MSFPLKNQRPFTESISKGKTKNQAFCEPSQIYMLKFKLTFKSTLSGQHQGSETIMIPEDPPLPKS